jgi:hypothetical protein
MGGQKSINHENLRTERKKGRNGSRDVFGCPNYESFFYRISTMSYHQYLRNSFSVEAHHLRNGHSNYTFRKWIPP